MEGIIVNFRRGRRSQVTNQMIIQPIGIEGKEKASKLVGKTVAWLCPGKDKKVIKGKVSSLHGGKGCVRALFERGMPGQSVGTKIKIE